MVRILEGMLSAALYFFAAVALGGLCIAFYLWFAWGLSPAEVRQGLAVMRGASSLVTPVPVAQQERTEPPEEPSYPEILAQRTLEYRDIELKNKMLAAYKDEIENIRQQIDKREKIVAEKEKNVDVLMVRVREEAENAGLETVRRTFEALRPAQAKELITGMLERNEMADVVRILRGMNDSKRARIIGEFRTPQEAAQIAEVLRRLREGDVAGQKGEQAEWSPSGKGPSQGGLP